MPRIPKLHRAAWRALLTGAALVLVLGACDWTMAGYDATRSSANPSESQLTAANVNGLSLRLGTMLGTYEQVAPTHPAPAVAGGSVFVAGENGGLSVYDAAGHDGCTGDLPPACDAPRWHAVVPAAAQRSSPTVVGGTVYLGGSDGKVEAFDAKGVTNCTTQSGDTTCTPLRTYDAGGPVATSPAVANGVLYVTAGATGRTLYAFDAAGTVGCSGDPVTCAPRWRADLDGVGSDPTVVAGRVYVGTGAGTIAGYDADGAAGCSGNPVVCSPQWTATLSPTSNSISTAAYAKGVLYATSADGRLYAVAVAGSNCTGTPVSCTPSWRSTVSTRASAPAVGGGTVFSATPTGVQAFDATGHTGCSGTPKTCTARWTASGSTAGTPALANGVLYVGEAAGSLKAFDATAATNCSGTPKTCQPLWTGAGSAASPVVANGTVYSRSDTQTGCCDYRYLLAYAIVPPQIAVAPFFFADGKVPVNGIGFPRSAGGVVTVTDLDRTSSTATANFTARADGSFYDVEVTLPVWQCGDRVSATVTVGSVTVTGGSTLVCPT